jgi:hypothetical protein
MKERKLPKECRQSFVGLGKFFVKPDYSGRCVKNEGITKGGKDDQGCDQAPVGIFALEEADCCLDISDYVCSNDQQVKKEELDHQVSRL